MLLAAISYLRHHLFYVILSVADKNSQVSTINSMRKYEGVFECIHASFIASLTIYRNSCEELLTRLDLPVSQLFEILEKIDGEAWTNPTLDASVRDRPGNNYLPLKSSV